jgi:hypothetical protein
MTLDNLISVSIISSKIVNLSAISALYEFKDSQ